MVAIDQETKRTLWEAKAYQTTILPLLERDVQSVFITGLSVNGDQLVVRNEAGKSFSMNLSNGKTSDAWRLTLAYTVGLGFIAVVVGFYWRNRRRKTPTVR